MNTKTVTDHQGNVYRLKDPNQGTVIVQSLESGDYLYPQATIEQAWQDEQHEHWVKDDLAYGEKTLEEIKAEFVATLAEYTADEILRSIEENFGWAINCDLVVKVEEDEQE